MVLTARYPTLISELILSNGMLPYGAQKIPWIFYLWRYFAAWSPILPVGRLIAFGSRRHLKQNIRKGYDFPFNGGKKKTAIRVLPGKLPFKGDDKLLAEACWEKLKVWDKPVVTIFGKNDPFTRDAEKIIKEQIPGAKSQFHVKISGGHFLQEDAPELIVQYINEFMHSNI